MCPSEKSGFILSNVSELEIARNLAEQRRKECRHIHLTGKSYLTRKEYKMLCYHLDMIKRLKESGVLKPDYEENKDRSRYSCFLRQIQKPQQKYD